MCNKNTVRPGRGNESDITVMSLLYYTWSMYHLKVKCDRLKVCTINPKATYKTIQVEVIANKPGNGIIKTLT